MSARQYNEVIAATGHLERLISKYYGESYSIIITRPWKNDAEDISAVVDTIQKITGVKLSLISRDHCEDINVRAIAAYACVEWLGISRSTVCSLLEISRGNAYHWFKTNLSLIKNKWIVQQDPAYCRYMPAIHNELRNIFLDRG